MPLGETKIENPIYLLIIVYYSVQCREFLGFELLILAKDSF